MTVVIAFYDLCHKNVIRHPDTIKTMEKMEKNKLIRLISLFYYPGGNVKLQH